jgi:hypothetical protein
VHERTAEVDQSEIENELRDLHDGHVSFPPDLVACCCSPVVVIHDDMYEEIERDDSP